MAFRLSFGIMLLRIRMKLVEFTEQSKLLHVGVFLPLLKETIKRDTTEMTVVSTF